MANGPEFFQTVMGHQFYEGTMPRIAKALEKIAAGLNREHDKIRDVAQAVVESADDTGCTDDLTVVSREAVERLRNLLSREA